MNKVLLILSLTLSCSCFAGTCSLSDSTSFKNTKFEAFIKKGIQDSIPFYVSIDSSLYILSDIRYDEYYRVIQGHVLRFKKEVREYPYNILALDDYSTLSNGLDQIRLLDIQEARHIVQPQENYKRRHYCEDKMILANGDTIVCRIFKVSESRVEYQKCSQKIKRVYGKDKDKLSKIIFHNGNILEFDSPSLIKQKRIKRDYTIQLVGVSLLMLLLAGASILLIKRD